MPRVSTRAQNVSFHCNALHPFAALEDKQACRDVIIQAGLRVSQIGCKGWILTSDLQIVGLRDFLCHTAVLSKKGG